MSTTKSLAALALLCAAVATAATFGGCSDGHASQPGSVLLCDGETEIALATLPTTRTEAQSVAVALMGEWRAKNPDADWAMPPDDWESQVRARHLVVDSYDNSGLIQPESQGDGHSSRRITERDVLLWKRESERFVALGARIFHSAEELGSTIAVSCDMCHPDAANTHPETYPKYQTQIGQPVLLRDMINWCLEHPLRAPRMADDDPRMRALEAYIYGQRAGAPLTYGRH